MLIVYWLFVYNVFACVFNYLLPLFCGGTQLSFGTVVIAPVFDRPIVHCNFCGSGSASPTVVLHLNAVNEPFRLDSSSKSSNTINTYP